MSGVRVLVGTRRARSSSPPTASANSGTSAARTSAAGRSTTSRDRRPIPNRIYASQSQRLVRPDHPALERRRQDLGAGRATSSPTTACPARTSGTTARRTRGSSSASGTSSRRSTDPDIVYAGVEDAALFRTTDGGQTWQELPGLRGHGSGSHWQPGAGGLCLHTILLDPDEPRPHLHRHLRRRRVPHRRRRRDVEADQPRPAVASTSPTPTPKSATASTASRMHPSRPDVLFMQKHWDVMRSDDAGEHWREVSGNLPTDFGFPDRRPRPRAGHDLRRPDQERLGALPARRQAARLPQPHRRQRVGAADQRPAAAATAT